MTKPEFEQIYEIEIIKTQNEIIINLKRKSDGEIIFPIRIPLVTSMFNDVKIYRNINEDKLIDELISIAKNMIYSIYTIS